MPICLMMRMLGVILECGEFLKEKRYCLGITTKFICLHMEMAIFFFSSSDLYLRYEGLIAFVMPRSVLTEALYHVKFKHFKKTMSKLLKILDLEDVSLPLEEDGEIFKSRREINHKAKRFEAAYLSLGLTFTRINGWFLLNCRSF